MSRAQKREFSRKAALRQEVASISDDPLISVIGEVLTNPDEVLLGQGRDADLYEELWKDGRFRSDWNKRRAAVIGREWRVEAASDSAQDKRIAEWVTEVFKKLSLDRARKLMLEAVIFGYSVTEIVWDYRKGYLVPVKLKAKKARRFAFSPKEELRQKTRASMWEGEPVPDRKFLVTVFDPAPDNPYGRALGMPLHFLAYFKKNLRLYWMKHAERFGSPPVYGRFPRGSSPEEKAALLRVCQLLKSGASAVINDRQVLETLEAKMSSWQTFAEAIADVKREISITITGSDLGTDVSGSGGLGGGGAAGAQSEIRQDIIKDDADSLCEVFNGQLIPWIVGLNFAGITEFPQFWIKCDDDEDLNSRAKRDVALAKTGLPLSIKYLRETYGLPAPESKEDTLIVKAGAVPDEKETDQEDGLAGFAEGEEDPFKKKVFSTLMLSKRRG